MQKNECEQLSVDYGEKVAFRVAVKKTAEESFLVGLIDYMQGRVETVKCQEYYGAFPIKA